ncbi:MAG: enoyl-CoA hydratase/isomerase family protein [Acidimicrobiia bacterium]
MTLLLNELDRGVRRLTLNRPDKLNALSKPLVDELSVALAEAAADTDTRVIVLAGAGRSFCAGYDLTEELTTDVGELQVALRLDLDRLLEVFDHPQPIIGRIQGHCLAGGCDLMMLCDVVVAASDAVFGLPEITFGSAVVANVLPWSTEHSTLPVSGDPWSNRSTWRQSWKVRAVPNESSSIASVTNRASTPPSNGVRIAWAETD